MNLDNHWAGKRLFWASTEAWHNHGHVPVPPTTIRTDSNIGPYYILV